ncbi:PAQR family membrane homeostasis protein TrhA [Robiginitalea sp. IMCC43444]|uniref:PAQR family membrane homeostasis protein TrhA n=1 Tax=Robiginitalea sp. IMCC43444 TaxID=3459121 RepID=UPI0040420442
MKISYRDEEYWNTGTHALGILLGVIGMIYLLLNVREAGSALKAGLWIYSLSVILLFSASTIYHAVANPGIKRKLRILDHISIYYLIAGTYTPVCLSVLEGSRGDLILWAVWGMALFGTVLKLFFTGKFELFSLLLYLLMGWLIAFDFQVLSDAISELELFWLAAGGAFYTLGIFFYAMRRIPFNHMIWHFFVLGGAISHWIFIYHITLA